MNDLECPTCGENPELTCIHEHCNCGRRKNIGDKAKPEVAYLIDGGVDKKFWSRSDRFVGGKKYLLAENSISKVEHLAELTLAVVAQEHVLNKEHKAQLAELEKRIELELEENINLPDGVYFSDIILTISKAFKDLL